MTALLRRADALDRAGHYRRALELLKRAARASPGDPAPHARASEILGDQAFYRLSLAALDRAIALAPGDPALRARRARLLGALGRRRESLAEHESAVRLAPRDRGLLLGLALARLRADLPAPAGLPRPEALFFRGARAFRAGRWSAARAAFLACAGAEEGPLEERARRLAAAAAILGAPGPALPRSRLYLLGIGIRHPWQSTVEVLRALRRCRVIHNNIGDPEIDDFLSLFPAEVLAVERKGTAAARARRLVAGARGRGPVGFVTRIHPFIYRQIAWELHRECLRSGLPLAAFGAVSLTEVLAGLAGAPVAASGDEGFRVFDIDCLVRRPGLLDEDRPTIVYCIADARRRRALAGLLRRRLPRGQVLILPGAGDGEERAEPVAVSRLEAALLRADSGALLWVPPRGTLAPRPLPADGGHLLLCGLGTRPGSDTTWECVRALQAWPRVFVQGEGEELRWVRRFAPRALPAPSPERVVRAARRGPVALACWGHPHAGSPLAARAERLARRSGVPTHALGAVSPLAAAFARTRSFMGGGYGYPGAQFYALSTLASRPELAERGLPLVVHARGSKPADWSALARALAPRYPRGHAARAFLSDGREKTRVLSSLGAVAPDFAFVPPDPRVEVRTAR